MKTLFREEVFSAKKHKIYGSVSLTQPQNFKYYILLLLTTISVSVTYLLFAEFNRYENATGVIFPSLGVIKVNAHKNGYVENIKASEGMSVTPNDSLLTIASKRFNTKGENINELATLKFELEEEKLKRQLEELKTIHTIEEANFNKKIKDIEQSIRSHMNKVSLLNERIEIKEFIIKKRSKLKDKGLISSVNLLQEQDRLLSLKLKKNTAELEYQDLKNKKNAFKNENLKSPYLYSKNEDKLISSILKIRKEKESIDEFNKTIIKSPIEGQVAGIIINLGEDVSPHQYLLSIIPKNSVMQAILYVPTSAGSAIKLDQIVNLKLDAFPHHKFGSFKGRIIEISTIAILPNETKMPNQIKHPAFRIVVKLDKQKIDTDDEVLWFKMGMNVEANIVIEKRPLLFWLFDRKN